MAGEDELIAAGREVEDVREEIGATSLAYLSLDGLQEATRRPADSFCRACLTKSYPTRIPRTSASRSSASSAPPRSSVRGVSPDASCWLVGPHVQDGRLQVGHVEHRVTTSDPTPPGSGTGGAAERLVGLPVVGRVVDDDVSTWRLSR